MPRSSALDAKTLLALGPERLAELLLELAASDPAIKRQIKLAVASSSSPQQAAAQVRQRLVTIGRSRRFLEREQRQLIRKDLTAQLDAITGPIAQGDAAAALELLWQFLELGDNVLGRCDDSSGLIGDIFRDAIRQLGPIATAARPEPLALAEQVFEAFCHNGYGVFDDVIQQLAETLGPVGLAALKQRFQQLGEQPVPVPPREESSRQWTVKLGLQAVAEASGDVDGFIAQYTPEQQRFPRIAAEIAQRLLAAGRAEDALGFLTRATPDRSRWPEMTWEHTHIAALQALGRTEEAQAARWNCFERCLDGTLLRAYLDQLPAFEDVEAEQRAIAHALAYPSLTQSLCFLLSWPSALAHTAELVVKRRSELEGAQYGVMGAAAEKLSKDHPLAATLALRSMVDFSLAEARSSRYGHAARHLQTCALLSQRIDGWGDIPSHQDYLAAIRSGHGRKSAFWQRMRELRQS
ncbi:hypothetical protein FQK07_10025 [Synechococcus sp. BSF8S]|uniref:DUF6880 family protein n=1 Tax=Synechococcales TaxID=1890424 RepID=UPI001626DB6F|nr:MULTISPECIES: DUF6880 family protein [unclassified Synechococcus]MBC1261593.1 hypothetical protein [Synechococcus sp. BSF8S]MBC1264522.1 hypothetical protein [Synechococcus sp. BSA11S]